MRWEVRRLHLLLVLAPENKAGKGRGCECGVVEKVKGGDSPESIVAGDPLSGHFKLEGAAQLGFLSEGVVH